MGDSGGSRKKDQIQKVAEKFELKKKLGVGCFGQVYRGVNIENGAEVAVKLEDKSADAPQLAHEAEVLDLLTNPGEPQPQGFTVPKYFFGAEGPYLALVMPICSLSVEDCVQKCNGKFSVETTLLIADQMLRRIEYLHSKEIVHRDIKPENFMLGHGNKQHHVYIIDFGLSKRYWVGGQHIPFKQGRSLTGTARYAALNVHRGHEQGRRDDLEAIGHMLMYFLRGVLPWSGLDAKTKEEKYRKIKEKKESVPLEELCAGYPKAFKEYLHITREMQFKDRPPYTKLRGMFQEEIAMDEGEVENDYDFDWYQGKPPPDLEPIGPWYPPGQPDDELYGSEKDSKKSVKKRSLFLSLCPRGKVQSAD